MGRREGEACHTVPDDTTAVMSLGKAAENVCSKHPVTLFAWASGRSFGGIVFATSYAYARRHEPRTWLFLTTNHSGSKRGLVAGHRAGSTGGREEHENCSSFGAVDCARML